MLSMRCSLRWTMFCNVAATAYKRSHFVRQSLRCISAVTRTQSVAGPTEEILQLTCTDLSSSGEGVCRTDDGCVVFVESTLPGEVVEALVVKHKKSFARAYKLRSLSPHDNAVKAPCPLFGHCGGCSLQSVDYAAQLRYKQQDVVETLRRIGKVENAEAMVRAIVPCTQHYEHRNKMEFSFSNFRWWPTHEEWGWALESGSSKRERQRSSGDSPDTPQGGSGGAYIVTSNSSSNSSVAKLHHGDQGRGMVREGTLTLGLFKRGSNRVVVQVSECLLQPGIANQILMAVLELCKATKLEPFDFEAQTGVLQSVVIRTARRPDGIGSDTVEVMLNFVTTRDCRRRVKELALVLVKQFPNIASVMNTVSDPTCPTGERVIMAEHLVHGRHFLLESLCGLDFEVSANSFFQTNTQQAERMYELVRQSAELQPTDVLLDLYCGTGTIGLALAESCGQVYGVEMVQSAVDDAQRNAIRNCITNARFVQADLDRNLDRLSSVLGGRLAAADVVVVDPPRAGLSPEVVAFLRSSGARRVVYVSCNPATLSRDIARLCVPLSSHAGRERASRETGRNRGRQGGQPSVKSSSCEVESRRGNSIIAEGALVQRDGSCDKKPSAIPQTAEKVKEAAYSLAWVQPCDMFPHSMHVECVAVLDRVLS